MVKLFDKTENQGDISLEMDGKGYLFKIDQRY